MRETVVAERGGRLLDVASDVGRIDEAAGWRAAADGLKVAEEPGDVARVAKLAEKEGSRTRAILKLAGRGAIMFAAVAFEVFWWILAAVLAVLGFVCALKRRSSGHACVCGTPAMHGAGAKRSRSLRRCPRAAK